MFGFSTREVLSNAIINASENQKGVYKAAVLKLVEQDGKITEEEQERLLLSARREYLNSVADSVIDSFRVSSPAIHLRIQLALETPSICGYDIDLANGISAGSLYAICYYALKNKVAVPKDCSRINHLQNDIMQGVLIELANG